MPVLLLSACSSVNTQQNQRLESIEEKVDALLVYNNKTYDIMVDNELRISELEKDAKVRGVPVPQKNVTVDSLPSPHAVIKNEEPQPLPEQEASEVKNVGALTGQDLTNQPLTKAEEKNQLQVTENIVENKLRLPANRRKQRFRQQLSRNKRQMPGKILQAKS